MLFLFEEYFVMASLLIIYTTTNGYKCNLSGYKRLLYDFPSAHLLDLHRSC